MEELFAIIGYIIKSIIDFLAAFAGGPHRNTNTREGGGKMSDKYKYAGLIIVLCIIVAIFNKSKSLL